MSLASRAAATLRRHLLTRLVGMGLLLAAVVLAPVSDTFDARWIAGAAALAAGFCGAPPLLGLISRAVATLLSLISRFAARLREDLTTRLVGMGLLLAALDPAHVSNEFGARWVVSAAALVAGFWAAPPLRERPAMTGYRLTSRIARYRNTLLPCVGVLLAVSSTPPTWLMVADLVLVLGYLSLLDLTGRPPGAPVNLGWHTVAAWAAAGVVMAAALAPVSGGWWGRIVAAAVVLVVSALMYLLLRLRKPATYHASAPEDGRRH